MTTEELMLDELKEIKFLLKGMYFEETKADEQIAKKSK